IPLNFMVTVAIGFVVGIAVSGQTFYMLTTDNLQQFGALKAMGTTGRTVVAMVLLQAAAVAALGYGVGIGVAAALLEFLTRNIQHLAGFYLPWQVMAGTAAAVAVIMLLVAVVSVRPVLRLEPLVVFKG